MSVRKYSAENARQIRTTSERLVMSSRNTKTLQNAGSASENSKGSTRKPNQPLERYATMMNVKRRLRTLVTSSFLVVISALALDMTMSACPAFTQTVSSYLQL